MHPNSTERTKMSVLGPIRWIGCVSWEKFRRDFVARTFALVRPVLAPSFIRHTNCPKCPQIVRNAPKRQFRVQWGRSGSFVAKKFRRDFVARTFALVRPVLHRVSEGNQTVPNPNSTKRTETSGWGLKGRIGCVRYEKFRRDFVA